MESSKLSFSSVAPAKKRHVGGASTSTPSLLSFIIMLLLLLLQYSNYEPLQLIIAKKGLERRGLEGLDFEPLIATAFFRYEKECNNVGADLVTIFTMISTNTKQISPMT